MKFFRVSSLWFEVWSDLFINLAAGWFAVVFIVPNINFPKTFEDVIVLTYRLTLGMLTLIAAKFLKEQSKNGNKR